jgi:demethoxyubiquinone hydroxylase (CLK1/Coq7/Cat5 family)
MDDAKALGGLAVMLVRFGEAATEIVFLVVDRMGERQLNKLLIRENLFDFRADELVHPVVVVEMQKAAAQAIITQILSLLA